MWLFFLVNHSFITQIGLLHSECKHCSKKLGGWDQAKDCKQDDACCTQRCAAKFADLRVCMILAGGKVESMSSTSLRIAVTSEWCLSLFFQRPAPESRWAVMPSGIKRTPSCLQFRLVAQNPPCPRTEPKLPGMLHIAITQHRSRTLHLWVLKKGPVYIDLQDSCLRCSERQGSACATSLLACIWN
jgi:hypothetical protein